eukprot:GEMP01099718.1.p1 GENE.GEMP01099718.1~~GEMP01099718.1.p1  ORF type:complete len:120 (+),score=25.77 GEMP01099718.1:289-648(+)
MEEYRNFLTISQDVYDYVLANWDEIHAGGVTVELRPSGVTSPPLIRLSGPAYRCKELWEYHFTHIAPAKKDKSESSVPLQPVERKAPRSFLNKKNERRRAPRVVKPQQPPARQPAGARY